MDIQCREHYHRRWVEGAQREACYGAAKAFYVAVRDFVSSYFR